jgi:hypothetical protein
MEQQFRAFFPFRHYPGAASLRLAGRKMVLVRVLEALSGILDPVGRKRDIDESLLLPAVERRVAAGR